MWKKMKQCMVSEDGVGTVEIILILVVLIALVVIFREQLISMVNDIFDNLNSSIEGLY
ncbi:MAG: hypothetical protein IJ468_00675 [Lachnospiraceae bacterium]|nr:hypothetical protein [Lachnospiraceae bacterium]